MVLLVASASLRDKPGYAYFAVAKAGPRVIAQSMAPEYGPRDLRVARVAIGGRIDGDPSTRDSAPSRSAFRIHAPGWGQDRPFMQAKSVGGVKRVIAARSVLA
jgi:hypothetical protein